MTPDGISTHDWEKVMELAADIANAVGAEDHVLSSKYTEELLAYLEELKATYGALSSILATRADYVAETTERLDLLKNAYTIAHKRGDTLNLTSIASSLAQTYIDDLQDIIEGQRWLSILNECLAKHPDPTERAEYNRLSQKLREQS